MLCRSLLILTLLFAAGVAAAQNPQALNPAFAPGNQGFNVGGPQQVNQAGQGGGANADFDSLIDLIVSTVASETWAENGGGEAEIRPFVGGVYADADGVLRRTHSSNDPASARSQLSQDLTRLKQKTTDSLAESSPPGDARRAAALRCVSLTRLEREIDRRVRAGEPLDQAMLTLAGLRRVEYVFAYPETGEVALAGRAGDWRVSDDRRLIATDTGEPVVRLDDLLTLLRRDPAQPYGCSIDPRAESLAQAQAFLAEKPIPASKRGRDRWLEDICATLGAQDLTYQGVPRDSRIACVLGEADYHMKLLGMGLAEGAAGMESYLESIRVDPDGTAPALGAVRWWFGMSYTAVETNQRRDAFAIVGAGVKLMSENEALAAQGRRVPTGQSDEHAQAYATAFNAHFDSLCKKHAVYAELRNVFDLSLVAALLRGELLARVGWEPSLLTNAELLPLPRYRAPTQVETVANLRVVNRRQVLAGVSGGVWARPVEVLLKATRTTDAYGPVTTHNAQAQGEVGRWWWDMD